MASLFISHPIAMSNEQLHEIVESLEDFDTIEYWTPSIIYNDNAIKNADVFGIVMSKEDLLSNGYDNLPEGMTREYKEAQSLCKPIYVIFD